MTRLYLSGVAIIVAVMGHASAETPWKYSEIEDSFTDKTHYVASIHAAPTATTPSLPSDNFKVSFECRNGKEFVFSLYGGKSLGERNEPFKVQYRTDNKHSKTVRMRIFTNTETGGMNKVDAIDVANDVLNAGRLRIRVIAANGDQYDAEAPLENSRQSILKTIEACGLYVRE